MHGRTPQPEPDQYLLDYDGPFHERMAVLRAKLRGIDPAELELSVGVWELVCEVVQAVFAHAGAERGAWSRADLHALAEGCLTDGEPLTHHQVKRYRTQAAWLGLVERGGRHPDYRWRVDLDRIDRLAADGRAAGGAAGGAAKPRGLGAGDALSRNPRGVPPHRVSASPSPQPPLPQGALPPTPDVAAPKCAQLRPTAPKCAQVRPTAPHIGNPVPKPQYPNPKTPSPPDPEPAGHGAAAAGLHETERACPPSPPRTARPSQPVGAGGPADHVEGGEGDFCKEATPDARTAALEALRGVGLGARAETLATLERAGGGPEDAMALLAVYQSKRGAWRSPGVILLRAQRWAPGQRPDDPAMWPPPDPAWLAAQQRDKDRARREAELAAADARRAERERERERLREERAGYSVLAEYGRLTTTV